MDGKSKQGNEMAYYAHTRGSDKTDWQKLVDHLSNTSKLAADFGIDAGVSDLARIAGRMHDIGKYSLAFQRRLEGAKSPVDHSTAGAKELIRLYQNTPRKGLADILAYCIAGHHTGLPDGGSPIDLGEAGTLRARLQSNLEDYSAYQTEIDLATLTFPARLAIRPLEKHIQFSVAFLTRMVYSALVDADFQDTEETIQGKKPRGGYASIEDLCQKLNQYLQKFTHPESEINRQRSETLQACIGKAAEKRGFFTLTVPTGGGKTLASMAFALNHAAHHGLKRIIYVIPFTSIIEQNAGVFKECLGEENVLEHHSNFDWERKRREGGETSDDRTVSAFTKLKLAAENWDIPVVVTTNVQFFESLFANRSSRCRKLHNLAKSVIIFDEAQMLPREYLLPCMDAVWELVTNYGASAVFCTATQPALERFLPGGTRFTELAPDPQGLFDVYRRVRVKTTGKLPDVELLARMNADWQALCIVNTRKHARGLFEGLAGEARFHLSTLMCPAHRKAALSEIRERLKNGQPCRVVSTQVMEAGIDVDFPVGYRALAGLDSIIQASGRINRERKNPWGDMYVFEPDSVFVKKIPAYIAQGAAVARSILRDFQPDPISVRAINAYFESLYALQDGKRAFDAKGILDCFDNGEGLNFKTAAERFKIIDNDTVPVIIPYDQDARQLIEELKYTPYPVSTLRKLQMYTVNIYEEEYQALNGKGAIAVIADDYSALRDLTDYRVETGLSIPENVGGDGIIF
jgi:CRISPR-associated endonuclease/helicase Cas3